MDSFKDLRPGGSSILPEETPPKFYARHLSAYYFVVPFIKKKDVLEIGFGDGYGSDFLALYAKSIKAVDTLEKNVNLASAKYTRPNLEFSQMSAIDLNFSDEAFDAVVSFQVIEHIQEDKLIRYLGEIRRVLKKDGLLFVSTLNLDKNKKPRRPYNKNPLHVKEFNYREFDSLIKKVFGAYDIHGLFYGKTLKLYERLKKIGIFRSLPQSLNIVDKFYNNIRVNDFVWQRKNLTQSIDFMAVCRKV